MIITIMIIIKINDSDNNDNNNDNDNNNNNDNDNDPDNGHYIIENYGDFRIVPRQPRGKMPPLRCCAQCDRCRCRVTWIRRGVSNVMGRTQKSLDGEWKIL